MIYKLLFSKITITLFLGILLHIFQSVIIAKAEVRNCKTGTFWDDCFGKRNENGITYEGYFKDNFIQGVGKATFHLSNDETYTGDFEKGISKGIGVYKFEDGAIYIGEFENNKISGLGFKILAKGNRYLGEYVNGLGHGFGTSLIGKQKYFGEFRESKPDGSGYALFSDGTRYMGQFRETRYEGLGEIINSFDNTFYGQYSNGKMNGYGIWNSEAFDYFGQLKNGKWNGVGAIFMHESGNIYLGEFKDNEFHGSGWYFIKSSGNVAEGVWVNDKFKYEKRTAFRKSKNSLRNAFNLLSKENRIFAQRTLKVLGYYNGNLDGVFGNQTKVALEKYNLLKFDGKNNIDNPVSINTLLVELILEPRLYSGIKPCNISDKNNLKPCIGEKKLGDGIDYIGLLSRDLPNGTGQLTTSSSIYHGLFDAGKKHGKGIEVFNDGTLSIGVWENGNLTEKYRKFNILGKELNQSTVVKKRDDASNEDFEKNRIVPVASGTGFYVSKQGHIITNNHVIDACQKVMVHSQGNEPEEIRILSVDKTNDLALLKSPSLPKVFFPLAQDTPYLTQEIITAGYPLVSQLGLSLKVTKGIVSALSAPGNFSNIQIDAAVQPGNSGGPIFDEYGNVMGVVVARLDEVEAQNVNFGIKASIVKNLLVSNEVTLTSPKNEIIGKRQLSQEMKIGTVLLSCWMSLKEVENIKTQKILFKEFK